MVTPERAAQKHRTYLERKARDPEGHRERTKDAMRRWRRDSEHRKKGAQYMAEKRRNYTSEEREAELAQKREIMTRPVNQRRSKHKYTLRKFGLTLEQYEETYSTLLTQQAGLCAACGYPPHGREPLHLDHHHETGTIRALLCGNCNRALGILREDPLRITALLAYVEQYHQAT